MTDYLNAINKLRTLGLLNETDSYVVGLQSPSGGSIAMAGFMGGAIGGAVLSGKMKTYLLAANNEYLRFFEVDKSNGHYVNKYVQVNKSEITKCVVSKNSFFIKTIDLTERFSFSKKINGFKQKELASNFNVFMLENYKIKKK